MSKNLVPFLELDAILVVMGQIVKADVCIVYILYNTKLITV